MGVPKRAQYPLIKDTVEVRTMVVLSPHAVRLGFFGRYMRVSDNGLNMEP